MKGISKAGRMGKGRVRNGKTVGYDLATEVQVREEKKGKGRKGKERTGKERKGDEWWLL